MQTSVKNLERAQKILTYWFGAESGRNLAPTRESLGKWFSSSVETDNFIIENFASDLQSLAAGELDDWKSHRDGKLAAIILAD